MMAYRWYQSIRNKILVLVLAPLILLFCLLAINSRQITERILSENIAHSLRTYSQTLNLGISMHLATGSLSEITPFLDEFIGAEGGSIVYLALTNELGETIVKTPRTPDLDTISVNAELSPELLSQELYHVAIPILLEGGNVGVLHYGVSLSSIRQTSQAIFVEYLRQSLLGLGVIVTAMGGLLIWVLLRLNTRLKTLLDRSRTIAEGEYDTPIVELGKDEIGVLSQQMELMRRAIRSRIVQLRDSRQEVEALNDDLVETLDQLKQFQDSLVQAEKLASLGGIVAAVAHELNTPIGNALTVATTFEAKSRDFNAAVEHGLKKSTLEKYLADASHASELIVKNLDRAGDLVESFKHVAVDQTSSQRRKFNLLGTVDDLMTTLKPSVKHRPVTVRIDIPGDIEMDSFPGPLCQVITNLFNNAMVHAFGPDTPGDWCITVTHRNGKSLGLQVSDNGKGIARTELPRIFDPFYSTRLGQGGSGLGLHIVYNLSTAVLGGSVTVESELDKGTMFNLNLPLCPQTNASQKAVTA